MGLSFTFRDHNYIEATFSLSITFWVVIKIYCLNCSCDCFLRFKFLYLKYIKFKTYQVQMTSGTVICPLWPLVRVDMEVATQEIMTPQCGRSVVQILVVRLDVVVVNYEAMTPQCGRSVVQILVVRVDIWVVIYEAMTPQCGRSVVQVLVVRLDVIVVNYEAITVKSLLQAAPLLEAAPRL